MRQGRTVGTAVIALLVAGAGACGAPAPVTSPPATFTKSSTSSTSSIPSLPSSGLGFSDADNGRSATVDIGQRVTVILHSSDFVFAAPTDPSVLREDGPPTVTPGGPACTDAAAGCGTVVASFVAVGPGEATVTADRTGCVEPGCLPVAGHWELLLHVVGPSPTESSSTSVPSSPSPSTAPPAPALQAEAEVRGTVRFSPVCPVERIPPDPACAPRPGPADIDLVHPDGTVAAAAAAGDDGTFVIPVAPGSYAVRATVPAPGIGGGCQVDPSEITLDPGVSATVIVNCDTGIR